MMGMDWTLIAAIAGGSVVVVVLFALAMRLFKQPAKEKSEKKSGAAASELSKTAPIDRQSSVPAAKSSLSAVRQSGGALPLNANTQFTDPRTDDSTVPAHWLIWRNPQIRLLASGGISMRGSTGEKVSGLQQRTGRGLPELGHGSYVLRVRVRLVDGDLRGSAAVLTLMTSQADAVPLATHPIKFGNDLDIHGVVAGEGQVGSTYAFEARFAIEGEPLNARLHLGVSEKAELEFLEAAILPAG